MLDNYPFWTHESDPFVKHGHEVKPYDEQQYEAAATAWTAFCSRPMTAEMFTDLLVICDGGTADAVILWHWLRDHRSSSKGLKNWLGTSSYQLVSMYGAEFGNSRTYRNAFQVMVEHDLLIAAPKASDLMRKPTDYRLNWVELHPMLELRKQAKRLFADQPPFMAQA